MAEYETSLIAVDADVANLIEGEGTDPLAILRTWLEHARSLSIAEPEVIALATSDSRGRASVRMMHVLEIDRHRIRFATHAGSRKGRDIADTHNAAGAFYWRETKQQILVSGPIAQAPDDVSDRFWNRRPLHVNAMSVVARQSAVLTDSDALRTAARYLIAQGVQLPRPPEWTVYQIAPDWVEFWVACPDRLHTRAAFRATASGWSKEYLQP